jgi:hypothetical protein
MAQGLSKSSTLPAVSIGFALSILVATWVASGRFREMQTIDVQNSTLIEDIRSRQSKYIGVSGLLTQRIDDLEGRIRDLEVEMAVLKAELSR